MRRYKKDQLKKIRIALILDSKKRTKYLVKHNIFKSVGDNFFFQPRIIPADPKLIKFHNNVVVTSGVTFITHDIADFMLNNISNYNYKYYSGCIEVMDNVFIGCDSIILPNVRIGSNVIIGAGSIVTKDVPDNSVVAGNPARVISSFDHYIEKRQKNNDKIIEYVGDKTGEKLWEQFENTRRTRL